MAQRCLLVHPKLRQLFARRVVAGCHVSCDATHGNRDKGSTMFGLTGSMAAGARVVAEDRGAQPVA
jgi:hypothetical protein